jgi:hypothetical protein
MAARSGWLAKIAIRKPAAASSSGPTSGYVVGTATSGTGDVQPAAKRRSSPKSGSFECTRTASAPASAYARARCIASSCPSPAISASVRAMTTKSGERRAEQAASILRACSSAGTRSRRTPE